MTLKKRRKKKKKHIPWSSKQKDWVFYKGKKSGCCQVLTATFYIRTQWRNRFSVLGNLTSEPEMLYPVKVTFSIKATDKLLKQHVRTQELTVPMSPSWEHTSYDPSDQKSSATRVVTLTTDGCLNHKEKQPDGA